MQLLQFCFKTIPALVYFQRLQVKSQAELVDSHNMKGFDEPEQWFNLAHKHDSSSTEKLVGKDCLMKYGTDTFHITSDDRNISHKLVNTELNIADERGVRFLILDTNSYARIKEMMIIIIKQ